MLFASATLASVVTVFSNSATMLASFRAVARTSPSVPVVMTLLRIVALAPLCTTLVVSWPLTSRADVEFWEEGGSGGCGQLPSSGSAVCASFTISASIVADSVAVRVTLPAASVSTTA